MGYESCVVTCISGRFLIWSPEAGTETTVEVKLLFIDNETYKILSNLGVVRSSIHAFYF